MRGNYSEIFNSINEKETEELLYIWRTNDQGIWSDEAFTAIKEILLARGIEIPEQNKWKPNHPISLIYFGNHYMDIIKLIETEEKYKIIQKTIYPEYQVGVYLLREIRLLTLGHFINYAYLDICIKNGKSYIDITFIDASRDLLGRDKDISRDKKIIQNIKDYLDNNIGYKTLIS
jgi:hypothetical protein